MSALYLSKLSPDPTTFLPLVSGCPCLAHSGEQNSCAFGTRETHAAYIPHATQRTTRRRCKTQPGSAQRAKLSTTTGEQRRHECMRPLVQELANDSGKANEHTRCQLDCQHAQNGEQQLPP
ncbi:hypothetical protein DAEQUDRAFT_213405 [Daedalea quercina L-15889]|uniref:Uncharacterized protein n=1 Tax=Daedalea quercina L-15889 TaxID=1314783 RepID=A0A165R319_9APHY|nr:hypothetical protein DAEQUDRAFT_213405 [Daedalea quercina L-15889]